MVIVPDELVPRWRDLGAIGWLATSRLGGPIVNVPVLGRLACAAAWPPMVAILTRDRAQGLVAARGRRAVVMVRTSMTASSWRPFAAGAVAFLVAGAIYLAVPLGVLLAAVVAEGHGAHRLAAVLAAAALPVLAAVGGLGIACTAPGLRAIAPKQRRYVLDLAAQRGIDVVEAAGLAASTTDRRAATVLTLALIRHVDQHQLAVMACPRDARLALMYRRLGFQPIDHHRARIMVRWPRTRTRRRSATPTRTRSKSQSGSVD